MALPIPRDPPVTNAYFIYKFTVDPNVIKYALID